MRRGEIVKRQPILRLLAQWVRHADERGQHRWKQQFEQQPGNGDHYRELDQRESVSFANNIDSANKRNR